ncbi:MAG: FecR domain-containing protein [Gammaproteobacteria bacterium]
MLNQQIYDEAADWFSRMRDGEDDPAARGELMEWLRRSPEHVRAYLEIAGVWIEARHVAVDSELDLETRIARARSDNGVMDLMPQAARAVKFDSQMRRYLATAASVLLLLAAGMAGWWRYGANAYSTSVGEQRSVVLADGSTIELNSHTRVRVRFGEAQRTIELLRGEALFHVAKDAARPFVVRSGDTSVRAVGTVFDVYRKKSSAVVTVVEGTVVVESAARAQPASARPEKKSSQNTQPPRVRLSAGKQVIVAQNAVAEPKVVNVTAATAWTQRQLIFEFTPLAEAAEEFNRYNAKPLIVDGEALRAFRISAMFRSTDPRALVRYVQTLPGVVVEETDTAIHIRATTK